MIWDGGHTKQATWFNAMLKLGARTYDFRQLCETGTVVISRTGKIAVFSAEHAEEHARGLKKHGHEQRADRQREEVWHDVYCDLVHEQHDAEP